MNLELKNISIIISSEDHPINLWIDSWLREQSDDLNVEIIRSPAEAKGGDICFLISCTDILPIAVRELYSSVLVIHASDLPEGRGWSPHIWHIIGGGEKITVSLIEASEKVDQGDIWKKYCYNIPDYFLYDDIISIVNQAHVDLMDYAINNYGIVRPTPQSLEIKPTYFQRRTALDSEISPFKTIEEQFDNIRVCDSNRFPSFFHLRGKKFKIIVERYDD
jgi:methionyl-tRNA formyltransferase